MRDSPGKQFVDDLMRAMPGPEAKLRLWAALAQYEGCSIYLPMTPQAERRKRAAVNMLANGMRPAEAAAAIRERFQVSTRTAARDVSEARKMSSADGRFVADAENSTTHRSTTP